MRIIGKLYYLLLIALLSSCYVHEFPEEVVPEPEPEPPVPATELVIHLVHDTSLPLYTTAYYDTRSSSDLNVRHTINFYLPDSRTPVKTLVLTYPVSEGLDRDITVDDLDAGDYTIMVWTDYVEAGTTSDWFYLTSDFAAITLNTSIDHSGCNEARAAWRGDNEATVIEQTTREITVDMVRPMAKFVFIATDLREFAETVAAQQSISRQSSDVTSKQSAESSSRGVVNVDDYRVIFRYTGYMPCEYNMFTDHPADSRTGVWFEGKMSEISDEEMQIGFDHVLTNGSAGSVAVGLDLYDLNGTLLASTESINVPLKRSHYTEVRGAFLTAQSSGSVGISPDYDGQYNIAIVR